MVEPSDQFATSLSAFESTELVRLGAALQLLPENAHRSARLKAFVDAALVSGSSAASARLEMKDVERIFSSPPFSTEFAGQESPFVNPFVEELVIPAGAYRVFPGTTEGTVYSLRRLFEVLLG